MGNTLTVGQVIPVVEALVNYRELKKGLSYPVDNSYKPHLVRPDSVMVRATDYTVRLLWSEEYKPVFYLRVKHVK